VYDTLRFKVGTIGTAVLGMTIGTLDGTVDGEVVDDIVELIVGATLDTIVDERLGFKVDIADGPLDGTLRAVVAILL